MIAPVSCSEFYYSSTTSLCLIFFSQDICLLSLLEVLSQTSISRFCFTDDGIFLVNTANAGSYFIYRGEWLTKFVLLLTLYLLHLSQIAATA